MKNKIILSFLFLFIIFSLFNNVLFAYTVDGIFEVSDNIINEKPKRALYLEEWNLSDDYLTKFKSNGYISYVKYTEDEVNYYMLSPVEKDAKFYIGELDGKKYLSCTSSCNFVRLMINNLSQSGFMTLESNGYYSLNEETLDNVAPFSTLPVYTDSSFSEVFIHPVQESLAQVLEKNNPVKNFQTMMSGIIPYLIAFIIGLVAFWKGWQFLSTQLRKA